MPVDPILPKYGQQDPGSLLASQIKILAGSESRVSLVRARSWASATFSGTRHSLTIDWMGAVDPADLDDLEKILADHEFAVPGHFVADMLTERQSETQLQVEALSIIDPVNCSRE